MLKVGKLKTVSGYFDSDHHETLIEAAAFHDANAPAVYVTMNPLTPDLLARACNRVKSWAEETTADHHITRRRFLLLDADPSRPSGIFSTNAEHDRALSLMAEIAYVLGIEGWPKPILADSGNGAHALFVIDIANDESNKQLMRTVLQALAKRFDNEAVKLDQAVFNASRIVKLYGSVSRKGDFTASRPHRLSRLIEVPSTLAIVPFELLLETGRQAEPQRPSHSASNAKGNSSNNHQGFDLAEWIAEHGLVVRGPLPYEGGSRKWQLDCPFNPDHRAPDAFIAQRGDGTLIFHCSHHSCAGYHWREFRDRIEGHEDQSGSGDPKSVEHLLAELRRTRDIRILYDNIAMLAELSEAKAAVVYQELKGILGRELNQTDFRKAIKEARARQRESNAESEKQRGHGGHPYRIADGTMVRVAQNKNGSEIIPLTNFIATIERDIREDNAVEITRFFGIEAILRERTISFIIPASQLSSMNWPIEHIGPAAIVYPNQKDWARAAVQSLSLNIREETIFTHTGWRKVGDAVLYLHAAGAIGAAGAVTNIHVRLSGPLGHYELELPNSEKELIEAIRASLRIIGLAKHAEHITYVLLAAVYRACLRGCDFTLWICGPTGVFKTEVAALAQQHFGPAMNARHLPGNFSSTGNSLEVLAFGAKDALLVIDDFAPQGGLQDVARYHAAADRILRAAGNNQGRGRLSSDARLRETKQSRGLIISTGEDLPKSQSIRGRTFMVEVAQGDIDASALTKCQADAASGVYARAMAGFIQFIAARYDKVQSEYSGLFAARRDKATRAHPRTPAIVADLDLGFKLFLDFGVAAGAITDAERERQAKRCWAALEKVARAQRVRQEASEPAHRFLELLRASILSFAAHVASLDGANPLNAAQWGWRKTVIGDCERWAGAGKCIGWLDGSNLYLEPTASYLVAQEVGRGTGEPLVVSERTLRRRLHENGLLASVDATRETLTVRKRVQGRETPVLHLLANALHSPIARPTAEDGETEEFKC
jgi:hypothetical protein